MLIITLTTSRIYLQFLSFWNTLSFSLSIYICIYHDKFKKGEHEATPPTEIRANPRDAMILLHLSLFNESVYISLHIGMDIQESFVALGYIASLRGESHLHSY